MAKKIKRIARHDAVGTALVLHDDPAGVRRKHIADYKRKVTALERSSSVLKNLEEKDIPSYRLWVASEFADKQTAVMTLHSKYADLEMLYGAAEDYRELCRATFAQAYSKVTEAYANGTLSEMMEALIADTEEDFEDVFDDDDVFEYVPQGGDDDDCDGNDFGDSRGRSRDDSRMHDASHEKQQPDAHFKSLYRQLVRKLHPDFCPNQTTEEKSLWHELQDAYEWNDLSRLEQLLNRVKGIYSQGLDLWSMPISQIVQMTSSVSQKLRRAQEQIAQEKKAEYWDFAKKQGQKSFIKNLATRMHRIFDFQIHTTEHLISELEADIKRRITPRKKAAAKATSKKSNPLKKTKNKSRTPKTRNFWDDHFSG